MIYIYIYILEAQEELAESLGVIQQAAFDWE